MMNCISNTNYWVLTTHVNGWDLTKNTIVQRVTAYALLIHQTVEFAHEAIKGVLKQTRTLISIAFNSNLILIFPTRRANNRKLTKIISELDWVHTYSCNKITKTWIQISRQIYLAFSQRLAIDQRASGKSTKKLRNLL